MDELHSPNFQLKHNDMKNKQHVHKVFLYLFTLSYSSSCSILEHNMYLFSSAAAFILVTFLLLPNWWEADTGKMSDSLLSNKRKEAGKKMSLTSIILLPSPFIKAAVHKAQIYFVKLSGIFLF